MCINFKIKCFIGTAAFLQKHFCFEVNRHQGFIVLFLKNLICVLFKLFIIICFLRVDMTRNIILYRRRKHVYTNFQLFRKDSMLEQSIH